jgi:hypothetical protein
MPGGARRPRGVRLRLRQVGPRPGLSALLLWCGGSRVPASECACACVAAGREAEGVWRAGASLHAEHPDQDAAIQPCQSWREQARQVGRHAAECTALRAWRPPHPPPTRVPNRALQQAGQPCGPSTKGCLALQGMGAARGRRQRSLGQPTPGDGGGAPLPAALSLTTCGCLLRSLNFQPNTNPRCGRSGRCQSHHWQQKIAVVVVVVCYRTWRFGNEPLDPA